MDEARRQFLMAIASSAAAAGIAPAEAESVAATAPVALDLTAAPRRDAGPRLSYDGTPNGPVLRLRKGAALSVRLANRTGTPTALDWHGLRGIGPIEPGATIPPGGTFARTLVPPDSGCVWLHPAALPGLPDSTASGLRAALIVEEPEPPSVDRDVLLILSDGTVPGAVLVNGGEAPWRDTLVTGGRLRLRLLNGSTTRILFLIIEGAQPKVIAIDGQPCSPFTPVRGGVPIGPGARFELMLDAPSTAGATVRLLSRDGAAGAGAGAPDSLALELTTIGAAREPLTPIAALPPNPALPAAIALERSARADLVIEQGTGSPPWRLNGTASLALPAKPLLRVRRGQPVTLGLDNRAPVPVPVRVHGHAMRLLHAKDDGWEPYWRDSVILPPNGTAHVAFVAEGPGGWLIESAVFAQAAFGLRHWFAVA